MKLWLPQYSYFATSHTLCPRSTAYWVKLETYKIKKQLISSYEVQENLIVEPLKNLSASTKTLGLRLLCFILFFFFHCQLLNDGNNFHLADFHDSHWNDILHNITYHNTTLRNATQRCSQDTITKTKIKYILKRKKQTLALWRFTSKEKD